MNFKYIPIVIITFIIGLFACEEKDDSASFVGTWTSTRVEDGKTLKDNLTLTEGSFDELIKFKLLPTIFIDVLGAKGSLAYTGSTLILTIETVGIAEVDDIGNFGQMNWYTIESEEFSTAVDQFGGKTVNCEYEVNGDKMTLKKDIDEDKKYSEDEINEYTRVK